MQMKKGQAGVGLIEVLIALILLAIGVLGYVVLQLRAFDASAEAIQKSQAVVIMRGLAENIRINKTQMNNYPTLVRGYTDFSSSTAPTNCYNSQCTANQFAQFDAYQAARKANQQGMTLTMGNCPGVTSTMTMRRQCLYAFWGKTSASVAETTASGVTTSTADVSSCMGGNGVYVANASCLMMEVY